MPCYLFTYHAYGTWMPDRKEGFVQRRHGILPTNKRLAAVYREHMKEDRIRFDQKTQRRLIELVHDSCRHQQCRVHFVATDPTHVHVLTSWRSERSWQRTRSQIKTSMTRGMNQCAGRRTWFAKSASRRQVQRQEHFEYLVNHYLPRHRGWKWSETQGFFL